MLQDFDFISSGVAFAQSEYMGEDYLSEDAVKTGGASLVIKLSSMNSARFQKFLQIALKGKGMVSTSNAGSKEKTLSEMPDVSSVSVPAKPTRVKNPLNKSETLQSYKVMATLSDGQKLQLLVQFQGDKDSSKMNPSTKGFISEVKLNGGIIPLTTSGASASDLRKTMNLIKKGIQGNTAKYQKRMAAKSAKAEAGDSGSVDTSGGTADAVKIDQTGKDINTKVGTSKEQMDLAKKMRKITGGGTTDSHEGSKNISKRKQLKMKQQQADETRDSLGSIRDEKAGMESRISELRAEETRLQGVLASLEEQVAEFANSNA